MSHDVISYYDKLSGDLLCSINSPIVPPVAHTMRIGGKTYYTSDITHEVTRLEDGYMGMKVRVDVIKVG